MITNCDNQLLCDFWRCEAAGIARHVFGYRGKEEKIAGDIGNVFHSALELHFQRYPAAVVMNKFDVEYNKVVLPGIIPDEKRFERGNVTKIMERFVSVRDVTKFPFEVLETEAVRGYTLDYDDKGEIVFWGKRDMLVRDKSTGVIKPVDHKTTVKISEWFVRRHRLTSQLSGYCWLTSVEYGQLIGEAYINAIEVSKLPDSNGKCKLHDTLYSKCGPEHAVFMLYNYKRTPEQIEKWRQDAIVIAKKFALMKRAFTDLRMLNFALKSGAFTEHCQFCEYQAWCAAGFPAEKVEEYCVWEVWEPWVKGSYIEPTQARQRVEMWNSGKEQREYEAQYASAVNKVSEERAFKEDVLRRAEERAKVNGR